MARKKFEIGTLVAFSPRKLKDCHRFDTGFRIEPELEFVTVRRLDPAAQFATGVIVDYDGDYAVKWDDDCESLRGIYYAWWHPSELVAITDEDRRKMRMEMKAELKLRAREEQESL